MRPIDMPRISVAPAVVPAVRPTAALSISFAAVLVTTQRPAPQLPSGGQPQAAAARIGQYLAAQAAMEQGTARSMMLPALEERAQAVTGVGAATVGAATVGAAAGATAQARFAQLKPMFQQAEQATGVPWQIQAAQWAVETGWGAATPKDLATGRESNNLFGIKGQGPIGSVQAATTEVENGRTVQTVAAFRAYSSLGESVLDHAKLLASPYYASAHAAGQDLRAWTEQLGPQQLGYATDPQYGQKLWRVITENGWDK